jgi:hypothetical protein
MDFSCKKCGSNHTHIERKSNNTGLYCDKCGAWIKWLSKEELRAYTQLNIKSDEFPKECKPINSTTLIQRLNDFVAFLDKKIDEELMKEPLSLEDSIRKSSYCLALECDKNAILNIIEGREWHGNN